MIHAYAYILRYKLKMFLSYEKNLYIYIIESVV